MNNTLTIMIASRLLTSSVSTRLATSRAAASFASTLPTSSYTQQKHQSSSSFSTKSSNPAKNVVVVDGVRLPFAMTSTIYEDQLAVDLKEELINKLNEFASTSDNLEEVFENREQIEISRFYERLPKTNAIALKEFLDDKVYFRLPTDSSEEA